LATGSSLWNNPVREVEVVQFDRDETACIPKTHRQVEDSGALARFLRYDSKDRSSKTDPENIRFIPTEHS
jgi:hypothetical protein